MEGTQKVEGIRVKVDDALLLIIDGANISICLNDLLYCHFKK